MRDKLQQTSHGPAHPAVEKLKTRGPFKNGEMQGNEKIQGAHCIAHT